jgi:CHAD domain-containing protein
VFETRVLRRYMVLSGNTKKLEEFHDFRVVSLRRMRE